MSSDRSDPDGRVRRRHRRADYAFERIYRRWRAGSRGIPGDAPYDAEYGKTYWAWRHRVEQSRRRDYAAAVRRGGSGRLPLFVALRLRYARRCWFLVLDIVLVLTLVAVLRVLAGALAVYIS